MNPGTYSPHNSKLLAPTAFRFVLNRELRHAMRANGCLSLVTIETTRDLGGTRVSADDETMHEIAQVLNNEMRDRDLLGYTDAGTLSLVLRSTDYQRSMRVVDRIMARLERHNFQLPVQIALGAACYPMHAMGAESLKRWAVSHPVASVRASAPSSTDQN
jgi:GGDEF domain-containing protein